MHGDRMKKNIKVNYKSIFKYDDHHETVQFKSDGIYEKGFDKEKFTFYNNDQKIEIILKGKEMTLANGPSLLNLSYHRKIGNHYHTDYGMIELFTELITMEHDRYLKVKYILSDEHQQLSEVYVMMKYDFYGEENEESKKLLTNKILFSGLLILIQLIIVFVAFLTIHRSSRFFVYLFKLISVLAALYIINKDDASAYKITWLVLIAAVPFVGGVLYVFLGDKKPSQRLQFAFLKQIKNQRIIENDIIEEVADPYIKGQMNYLNQQRYPTYYGQDLKYFSLGDDAFEPLLESLRNAKKFIFMQFFIVDEGKMLKSVLDILKEKVKEGVEVRFMYDDVGSLTMLPRHYDRQLEKMGIKSVAFNPFIPVLSLAMNNRDHKKIVVIDGEIGFSGGFNLADEYINQRVKYGHWKDSGLMIHGPAVNSLTKMFLESWNVARNTEEDYEKYYVRSHQKFEVDGYVTPYGDSPLDDENVGENVYLDMINQAYDYLYITTPYLILDDNLQTALINAAKRGVDVRIITPGIPDKKIVFRVTRSYYQTLIKHGIRIYEYTPGFIHAKNFLVDDKCATVGTINLDYRSLYLHFENGIYLYNNKILKDIKEDFLATVEKSHEITLDEVVTGKFMGWFEAILRVIAPLL